jgi:hypothetical protein
MCVDEIGNEYKSAGLFVERADYCIPGEWNQRNFLSAVSPG